MKTTLFFLFALFFVQPLYADQLAYISKADAEKAVAYLLKHKKIILFCGCCDGSTPSPWKISNAEVRYTGFEEYYEVVITYKSQDGITTEAIDLAYVWEKKSRKTIGELLGLEHDPCKPLPR